MDVQTSVLEIRVRMTDISDMWLEAVGEKMFKDFINVV
jgi:hypothetical protein